MTVSHSENINISLNNEAVCGKQSTLQDSTACRRAFSSYNMKKLFSV